MYPEWKANYGKDSSCFNAIDRCQTVVTIAGGGWAERISCSMQVESASIGTGCHCDPFFFFFLISIAELTSPAFGLCSHHATQIEIVGWQAVAVGAVLGRGPQGPSILLM